MLRSQMLAETARTMIDAMRTAAPACSGIARNSTAAESSDGPLLADGKFYTTGVAQEGDHVPVTDDGRGEPVVTIAPTGAGTFVEKIGGQPGNAGEFGDAHDVEAPAIADRGRQPDLHAFAPPGCCLCEHLN